MACTDRGCGGESKAVMVGVHTYTHAWAGIGNAWEGRTHRVVVAGKWLS